MKRPVRVGVLGHWGKNIGHDIMTLGVECILKEAFGGKYESERIEQHQPFDIYPQWHPLRHIAPLRHGQGGRIAIPIKRLLNRRDVSAWLWRSSWIGNLDLGIVCGGPLITPHASKGDLELMFHHMHGSFASKGRPVLNLSVGSCYPWEKASSAAIDDGNREFLKRVFEYSRVTTVRDELAQRLCAEIGERCELVCDTGFAAGRAFAELARGRMEPRYVVINYQRYGANEDWGQNVDPLAWKDTLADLIRRISRRYPIIFVCHNEFESRLAKELDPTIQRHRPRTMEEYAQIVSGAIAGISSRIHVAIPHASVGVPMIGIGTDTRLGTLKTIGLPCFYVKEADAEVLEYTLEGLIKDRASESERLIALREATVKRYAEIVKDAITF